MSAIVSILRHIEVGIRRCSDIEFWSHNVDIQPNIDILWRWRPAEIRLSVAYILI